MEILQLAVMGTLNLLCFILGARTAQKAARGESVSPAVPSPMAAIRAAQAKSAVDKQQKSLDIMLGNIECYDGTPLGQKDVPGGE